MRGALGLCAVIAVLGAVAATAGAVVSEPLVASVGASDAAGGAAISADGRYVAFTSTEPLVGVPTGGNRQLYVRDLTLGRTLLASRTPAGASADADVDDPADGIGFALSGDGRYVVFSSTASNLTSEADGGDRDVFRADLATGAVRIVSVGPDGMAADGPVAGDPDVSFDGRHVVYESGSATNLWPGDQSAASDIVVSDLAASATALVSIRTGQPLTGVLRRPAISADGRTVVFEDDGAIVMRQLLAATTTDVSLPEAAHPDVSGNGRFVTFERSATGAVVRRDHLTGTETTIASPARLPQISADGQRVVAESDQSLLGGDGNGVTDIYARRIGGTFERVSVRLDGSDVDRPSVRPALAGNAGRVAFGLDDANPSQSLVSGDQDGAPDVLVATLATTDVAGPAITIPASLEGSTATDAELVVSGEATDPSGVVDVSVNGQTVTLGAQGAFTVPVPLPVGTTTVAIRAVDGAGNVGERLVNVVRTSGASPVLAPRISALRLRVVRAGPRTEARFVLPAGASRVVARLWRRVPRRGLPPTWAPVGGLKQVTTAPGTRRVVMSPRPLRPDVYQVRVTVVSPGGLAVTTVRHRVLPPR